MRSLAERFYKRSRFGLVGTGELIRRGQLDQSTVFKKSNPRSERERLSHIMRDKDYSLFEPQGKACKLALHIGPCKGVERSERLIHKDYGRVRRKRPRNADPLSLPAR